MRISATALMRGFRGSAGTLLILALAVVATGAQAELLHGGTQVSDTGLTGNSIASGNTSRNLAVGADGTIYAVFRGTNGIRVARSSNRGASFDTSVQLTSVNAEAEIAVSTTGIIYVTWPEGGRALVSRSLDGGQSFSASVDAGPATGSVHMATDASRVYLIDRPGNNFLTSHDNGLTFSHLALGANHVFADVHVDADSGDVIVVVDNPTVRYYISTDYGQSFSVQLTSSPTASVYYSVGALSSGSQGRFLFVAGGSLNDALRINLDTNAGSVLPFGNNTAFQGRSLSADRCGNVVDGYVNDATVQFQISNDLGVSFGSPVSVAEAAYANVFINQTNGDILFLYEQSGEIFLSVYVEELPCYSPELTLSTLVFPARLVGTTSSAQQVSITNPGENAVQVTGIQTTGDFAHFSECVGTLAAGESCAISVTFTPSDAGTRNGQVQISTNVFIEPRVVTLTGEGVGTAPVAEFSAASLAFGSQAIGSVSAPRTVVLSNSGNEYLAVDGFSIATGFAYSHDCPAELAPSQSCEVAVTFSPQAEQSYAGNLVLSSNAPGAPAAVALGGQGSALPSEYAVSTSVAAGEGSISPSSQQVVEGETAEFALIPADGFRIVGASGCDGTLNGATYTTAPITSACAVTAAFLRAASGNGTESDPFVLTSPEHIGSLADAPDAHFRIDGTIDLSQLEPRAPIGSEAEPFGGSLLAGPDAVIVGLDGAPLFGVVGPGARIEGLRFVEPQVEAEPGQPVGVLAAVIQGSVEAPVVVGDIVIDGGLVSGGDFAGGLAGQVSHAGINDVSSSATVQGGASVGGIVGSATDTSFANPSFDGAVSATGSRVGGIAGDLHDSLLHDAVVTGVVSGDGDDVGGLAGHVSGGEILRSVGAATVYGGGIGSGGAVGTLASAALLAETYATSTVHGADEVGGLVGRVHAATVRDSYAVGAVLASGETAGGLAGALVDANMARVYARGQVTGGDHAGGLAGSALTSIVADGHWDPESTRQGASAAGTLLTTAQMRDSTTFASWLVGDGPWGRADDVNGGFPYLLSATLFQVTLDATVDGVIHHWFGGYPLGTPASLELAPADDHEFLSTAGCGGSLQNGLYVTARVFDACTVSVDVRRVSPFLDVPEAGEIGSGESFPVSTDAALVPGDFSVTRNDVAVAGTIQCTAEGCRFTPPSTGRYTIVISDPDSGWTHEMTISVLPQVDLAPDQWVTTGDSVRVTFLLDDNAIDYPVAVPYTVSGSVSAGHDAAAGTIVIDAGLSADLEFTVGADAPAGNIVIALGEPDGARRGTRTEHVVHVWVDELPPMVDLAFRQWIDGVEVPTFQVVQSQGPVTLAGLFGDLPVDALLYDWSGSDSRLAISGSGPEVVLADVSTLDPGTYRVVFTVTTPGGVSRSAGRLLRVLADCPDTATSDGCGVIDAAGQGLSPSDADARHHLQVGSGDARPLRTLQGLTLRQGDAAFAARRDGAWVSAQELAAHAELGQPAHGAMPAGVFSAAYSFEIAGLASAGQSIPVVVPLRGQTTVPANARWYKYRNGQGWIRFVEDADNALHSAPATEGVCPGPNSASWQPGLNRGHACVRLTLQDGGPNDADGEDNGVIRDPSLLVGDHDLVVVGQSTGGGGSVRPWVLMVLGGCWLLAAGRRRRDAPRDHRPIRACGLAGLVAIGVFAMSAPSQALEFDGGYVGATGLRTSGGASAGDIGARLEAAGYTVDSVEVDRRRAGWRAYAGYQLSPRVAVEVGYVDLGRARSRVALTGVDTDTALTDVLAAMPLVGNGIDFGAVARQPVGDALTLMARASILRWEAERRATLTGGPGLSDKRRGTGVSLALGAELALGRSNWSVGIDLERNRVAGRDLDSVGLGVRYRL